MKSFERLREHYPNQKIQATYAKKLGSGGFGVVFETVERKLDGLHDLLTKQKANSHVRVAKYIPRQGYISPDDFKRAVFSEYELAKRTPHLHVKSPIEISPDEYCIVMDRQSGEELFDLCVKIREDKILPTAHQYILLVIALLQALQYQVEECGLVHQDIKPENIMLDWSDLNKPIIRIMDYGQAKDSNTVQCKRVGTPEYASPEVDSYNNRTIKADIFSLGLSLLMLLIEDYDQDFVADYRKVISHCIAKNELSFWKILAPVEHKLKNLLINMCSYEPTDRLELHELEVLAHEMRIELAYPGCSLTVKQQMLNACAEGLRVRKELSKSKSMLEMRDIIVSAIVVDEKEMVSEFLIGLNMHAFDGCCSRAELIGRMDGIVKSYNESRLLLAEAADSMRLLNKQCKEAQLPPEGSVNRKLNHCLVVLDRKLKKYDLEQCKSFDEIVHASKHCAEVARLTTAALSEIQLDFHKAKIQKNKNQEKRKEREKEKEKQKVKIAQQYEDDMRKRYGATIQAISNMLAAFNNFKQKYKDHAFFRHEQLGVVIDVCRERIQALCDAHDQHKVGELSIDVVVSANTELSDFLRRMPSVLDVMIKNRCQLVFARMQRYQLDSSLVEVMAELKQVQTDDSEDLRRLKCIIRLAISSYIYRTANGRNLFFKERAASANRIANMRAILQQVNEVKDIGRLRAQMSVLLGTIKTGFWGRSQLRSEVVEAMAIYSKLRS